MAKKRPHQFNDAEFVFSMYGKLVAKYHRQNNTSFLKNTYFGIKIQDLNKKMRSNLGLLLC